MCVGMNALMFASLHGHLPVVQYLTEKGTTINAINQQGTNILKFMIYKICLSDWNAIILATYNGHLAVVRFLCEHGIDIHRQDGNGNHTS